MDILRHFKQAQTLRLLALDLAGTLSLETLSDHLSDLACTVLEEVLRLAWNALRVRHRDQPQFAIVGYGKLGGKELGYASDLDIIFLYDDDAPDRAGNLRAPGTAHQYLAHQHNVSRRALRNRSQVAAQWRSRAAGEPDRCLPASTSSKRPGCGNIRH